MSEPSVQSKERVLCVDDEASILDGLRLQLERKYVLGTALGGEAGLELLKQTPGVAVIVSDMRMPGMDGATFLARTRELAPDAIRVQLRPSTTVRSFVF
jgi:CheY-like chemotaxis protein